MPSEHSNRAHLGDGSSLLQTSLSSTTRLPVPVLAPPTMRQVGVATSTTTQPKVPQANGVPLRLPVTTRKVPPRALPVAHVLKRQVAAQVPGANTAARPAPPARLIRKGHGQPRLLRVPLVIATQRHAAARGQCEPRRLSPAEETVGATPLAPPDEVAAPPVVTRQQQPPVVTPHRAKAPGVVVTPLTHRQTPRVAVPAINRLRRPRVGTPLRLSPRPAGVAILDVAVTGPVPPTATPLVAGAGVAGQVRRAALQLLLAAHEGTGRPFAPRAARGEHAVQVVRQATPVAGVAAVPPGKPEVQTLVVQDVAPVGPAVLVGVATAVLQAAEAVAQEGQRAHAAVLLGAPAVDAVPLAGRRRRLEVGGAPVGSMT